jgi:hypothetical protein
MAFSSSKITDVTKAKGLCLSTIAVSCAVIALRVLRRGHL